MKTILIVEDNSETQKIYLDRLTQEGFDVITTTKGEEALFYAKEKDLSLILLDIMLAGKMNGFDLLEALKSEEKLKSIPVLVLTNLDSEEKVAKEIGVVGYLVKANTSIEEVVAKVNKYSK